MKDWKTTAAGIATMVVGLLSFVVVPYLHGTAPNVAGFLATIGPGIAGILASDSGKVAGK